MAKVGYFLDIIVQTTIATYYAVKPIKWSCSNCF